MNRLSRSTALKIAAVIMVLLSLIDIVVFQIPGLVSGQAVVDAASSADAGPPFFMVLISFTIDVIALVAAYGAWNQQRWGVVLLIITAALKALPSLLGMIFAPDGTTKIIGGTGMLLATLVIVLCLWRERRPATGNGTMQATH